MKAAQALRQAAPVITQAVRPLNILVGPANEVLQDRWLEKFAAKIGIGTKAKDLLPKSKLQQMTHRQITEECAKLVEEFDSVLLPGSKHEMDWRFSGLLLPDPKAKPEDSKLWSLVMMAITRAILITGKPALSSCEAAGYASTLLGGQLEASPEIHANGIHSLIFKQGNWLHSLAQNFGKQDSKTGDIIVQDICSTHPSRLSKSSQKKLLALDVFKVLAETKEGDISIVQIGNSVLLIDHIEAGIPRKEEGRDLHLMAKNFEQGQHGTKGLFFLILQNFKNFAEKRVSSGNQGGEIDPSFFDPRIERILFSEKLCSDLSDEVEKLLLSPTCKSMGASKVRA